MIERGKLMMAAAAMALMAFVAGCATDVQTTRHPQLTFSHLPPITLNVARVDIVNAEIPSGGKHIEQQLPVTPNAALQQWAKDRLQPVGGNGVARFIITQSSVTEVDLPTTSGLRGAFTSEPAQRYDGVMEVTLEMVDGGGQSLDAVATKVQRQHSVNEKVTLAEREQQWFAMVDNMMQDFNRAFEGQIRSNLARYVMR
jgi:hypothetical protein